MKAEVKTALERGLMNQNDLDPQPAPEYRKLTRKEIQARYRAKNREKIRAAKREYSRKRWDTDPTKQLAIAAAHRERRREAIRQYEKQRRSANPEASRRACRKWHAKNAEREHERRRKYDQEHPERLRAAQRRRRAIRYQAKGSHTETEIQNLLELQGHKCADCRRIFTRQLKPTLDHVVPLTRGGTESIDNLRWVCKFCNSSKYNKSPEDWAAINGLLFI